MSRKQNRRPPKQNVFTWIALALIMAGAAIFLHWWSSQKVTSAEFNVKVNSYESVVIQTRIQGTLQNSSWPRNTYVITAEDATLEGPLAVGLMLDAKTSNDYILLKPGPKAHKFKISSDQVLLMSSVINEGDQLDILLRSQQLAASYNADRLQVRYQSSMTEDLVTGAFLEAVTLGGIEEHQKFSALLAGEVKVSSKEAQQEFPLKGGLGRSTNTIPASNWAYAIDPFTGNVNPFALLLDLTQATSDNAGKILISAQEELWMLLSLHDKATLTLSGLQGEVSVDGKEEHSLSARDTLEIVTEASSTTEAARVQCCQSAKWDTF